LRHFFFLLNKPPQGQLVFNARKKKPKIMDSVLNKLERRLHDLHERKSYLMAEVANVESEILQVQAEHGRLANQSTAIYRLPNEMLSYIFELCRNDAIVERATTGRTGRVGKVEVNMSHVSSHWRAVAISSPSLWSNLGLSDDSKLKVYLERSKGYPLDITFQFAHIAPMYESEIAHITLICAHIDRWRHVFLELGHDQSLSFILQHIRKSSAPLLQHFSMCPFSSNIDFSHPEEPGASQIFMGGAPKLTFVRLVGAALYVSKPPLSAMTTLHLDDVVGGGNLSLDYATFSKIINASPSLLNLSIMLGTIDWPTDGQLALSIPTLRSLRIYGSAALIYVLSSALSAPNLKSLVAADCTDDIAELLWGNMNQPADTPTPKFFHLTSLTFIDCYLQSCRSIFYALPAVTHFSLLGTSNMATLKAIGDDFTSSALPWPNLHTLTIERLETAQESLLCTGVISGRKLQGHPISKLRLDNLLRSKFKRRGKLEWLEQMVEVEKWSTREPWPPGLDFLDEDDPF
jgi:F-box-like